MRDLMQEQVLFSIDRFEFWLGHRFLET